jgi:hypothetical protein
MTPYTTSVARQQIPNNQQLKSNRPIAVAALSKARSAAGIVDSNPFQGMDVCVYSVSVLSCVGSGFATGWSPVQVVLPTVSGLRNWSETKSFTDALCSKVRATGKREKTATEVRCFLCGPCRDVITRTVSPVQGRDESWVGVSEQKSGRLLRGSWSNKSVRVYSPDGKDVNRGHVRIRYQETTNEDIEEFVCAAVTVIFTVCKPVRLL